MSDIFAFHAGDSPLLVSVPHDGRRLPEEQRLRMTPEGCDLPDTDWHVAELYAFATDLGASMIVAEWSRYVVDLNRPSSDTAMYEGQVATGLCPQYTFAGDPLYVDDEPVATQEVADRVEQYWRPYHERLATALDEIRARHGYALLWDAHSIAGRVPRLFDGELPVLNLGTFDDQSCDPQISGELAHLAEASPYDVVVNGRFKGGYITRHYGNPAAKVHAVQLELSQRAYMDESSREYDSGRADELRDALRALLGTFLRTAAVQ